ncbi:MAG: hypothetical protein ACJ8EP_04170 [Sphingomicrobium sp.]|jgi:hypothetical protein
MTNGRMIELAVAIVALAASVWLYRSQRKANEGYGSQGAVVLLVVGAIMAIHALGLLEYRPSASEIEAAKARAR